MHILVAEDDDDIAELIAHYLRRTGWNPHVVGALAYARENPVDLLRAPSCSRVPA